MNDEETHTTSTLIRNEPTAELIREAFDETRELVRLEVALAREEIRGELVQAKFSAMAIGTAGGMAISAFTVFMIAIALAFSTMWLAALVIGAILLVMAAALGFVGYKRLPTKPMGETVGRLTTEMKELKERIA